MTNEWHLVTSEYPPQPGGVSDYTRGVAVGLAKAGDRVHVWCPPADGATPDARGITVHREMGSFTRADLRRTGLMLNEFPAPRRLLVQWVPHGYGYRAMNLYVCLWLRERVRRYGDRLEIMVHEPFVELKFGAWRQNVIGAVQRLMTTILLRAAERVWVSIPTWERCWRPFTFGSGIPFAWLPVPSNVPVIADAAGSAEIRSRLAPVGGSIIGHFGMHSGSVAKMLHRAAPRMLEDESRTLLLLGLNGDKVRDELIDAHPQLHRRIHATGALAPAAVSRYIAACDLMLQLYPDGISSRRTSAMVGLAHGMPILTTAGHLTEDLWARRGAVALTPAGDDAALGIALEDLLNDATERRRLGGVARELYEEFFTINRVVERLRGVDES